MSCQTNRQLEKTDPHWSVALSMVRLRDSVNNKKHPFSISKSVRVRLGRRHVYVSQQGRRSRRIWINFSYSNFQLLDVSNSVGKGGGRDTLGLGWGGWWPCKCCDKHSHRTSQSDNYITWLGSSLVPSFTRLTIPSMYHLSLGSVHECNVDLTENILPQNGSYTLFILRMGKDASETIEHHAPYYDYNNASCLLPRPTSICVTVDSWDSCSRLQINSTCRKTRKWLPRANLVLLSLLSQPREWLSAVQRMICQSLYPRLCFPAWTRIAFVSSTPRARLQRLRPTTHSRHRSPVAVPPAGTQTRPLSIATWSLRCQMNSASSDARANSKFPSVVTMTTRGRCPPLAWNRPARNWSFLRAERATFPCFSTCSPTKPSSLRSQTATSPSPFCSVSGCTFKWLWRQKTKGCQSLRTNATPPPLRTSTRNRNTS